MVSSTTAKAKTTAVSDAASIAMMAPLVIAKRSLMLSGLAPIPAAHQWHLFVLEKWAAAISTQIAVNTSFWQGSLAWWAGDIRHATDLLAEIPPKSLSTIAGRVRKNHRSRTGKRRRVR